MFPHDCVMLHFCNHMIIEVHHDTETSPHSPGLYPAGHADKIYSQGIQQIPL
jgi:hypothetical protein